MKTNNFSVDFVYDLKYQEIVRMIALGYETKEIAKKLNKSQRRIQFYLKEIMDYTNTSNLPQLIYRLMQLKLLK